MALNDAVSYDSWHILFALSVGHGSVRFAGEIPVCKCCS